MQEDQAVINLPIEVLKRAVIGLLIAEGYPIDMAYAAAEDINGGEFQRALRKVASVALTLQANGLLKEPTSH